MGITLRVVTYNIHKGFGTTNLDFVLAKIKRSIHEVEADLVLLQEVLGHHDVHGPKIENWPTTSQFEYLADQVWPHFAYGKNAVYSKGHHGNAILSKFPMRFWENQDISVNALERRGLLHSVIEIPEYSTPVHVICLHLSLFSGDRGLQIQKLCERVTAVVPPEAALIVGGDFNDWRESLTPLLESQLNLKEAFIQHRGEHAVTFPAWFPFLRLDRLYFRGLECRSAGLAKGQVWKELSDHLPIVADFYVRERKK